jgi:hypothetical protein
MIKIIAYIACIPLAILVDWGMYTRISIGLIILRNLSEGEAIRSVDYQAHIFPRVLATALGALAICYDAFHQGGDRRYLWIGVALFLLSLLYAFVATYWSARQNHP